LRARCCWTELMLLFSGVSRRSTRRKTHMNE
jgi:hypothetical protein